MGLYPSKIWDISDNSEGLRRLGPAILTNIALKTINRLDQLNQRVISCNFHKYSASLFRRSGTTDFSSLGYK